MKDFGRFPPISGWCWTGVDEKQPTATQHVGHIRAFSDRADDYSALRWEIRDGDDLIKGQMKDFWTEALNHCAELMAQRIVLRKNEFGLLLPTAECGSIMVDNNKEVHMCEWVQISDTRVSMFMLPTTASQMIEFRLNIVHVRTFTFDRDKGFGERIFSAWCGSTYQAKKELAAFLTQVPA